jgi:hypothetical protein
VIPFKISLAESGEIFAQALLPQLGSSKGMIFVSNFLELCEKETELVNLGFGYSVLDEPRSDEEYDLNSYVEMFSEWGWGSTKEKKPDWMKDQEHHE